MLAAMRAHRKSWLAAAFFAAAAAGAFGAGCNEERDSNGAPASGTTANRDTGTPTPGDPNLITQSGTVRWLDLEGGFWGIVADDSTKYDPGTLDERFRKDGLRVRFDARKTEGQMSFRQWGTLVTIVRIDSL